MEPAFDLVDRVKKAVRAGNLQAKEITEVGIGILCVHDSTDDYDVFFDRTLWKVSDGKLPGELMGRVYHPAFDSMKLGILSGRLPNPPVSDFDEASRYAREMLAPLEKSAVFYAYPVLVEPRSIKNSS